MDEDTLPPDPPPAPPSTLPAWQEPPVFTLPGLVEPIISGNASAKAVLIPGVNGAFPQLLDFDSLSAPFIETQIRFHYQASNVAGEHASESSLCEVAMALLDRLVAEYDYSNENSSFMFFAYDLGGTVVKQALFTASMNEKYAIILAKTSLVVFYGTPHRSGESQTWAVNGLRILQSCFKGLLGPWVPDYIDRMSHYHNQLNQKFQMLDSDFRVISVCQKHGKSGYDMVVNASCGASGYHSETTVLLERSHYQLAVLLGNQQHEYVHDILFNETHRHWKVYKEFLAALHFAYPKHEGHAGEHLHGLVEGSLLIKQLRSWKDASASNAARIVRLKMSRSRDFDDFAASFYTHMKNADDEKANIILRLGSDRFAASERTADQLYASLCIQFLEQAPSLILWIRHLYPNTRDAVLGLEGLWKARALERLLRTLFLVPKRQITYCLFHCPKASPRNTLIGRILNVMEVSEIQLRLLVLVPDAEIGIQIVDNSPLVDLSSDSAIAGGHRPEPPWRWCKGVVNSRLTELWATIVAPRDYQIRSSALTIDKEPLQFSDSHNLLILAEQTLTRCFDNGITWVLRAVAWISFAVRPLSRLEAEQVLEVLCGNETSIPTDMKLGAELLNLLELILPGLLFIEHQALWVPPQLKLKLASIWDARSHENPDSFIAASCFNLAMNFFKKQLDVKAEPEACTQKHEDLDAAGTATPRAENDRAHEAIANYAVRYWIEHQRRGTQYPEKAEEVFRRLLESNPSLDLATWSRHIASCSWSCNIKDDKRQQIQPETLQSDFQLTPFAACYVSFRIASLPLTHDDNFEWLLLGTAIEHMSNDAILRKIDAVPTSKPNNLSSIMLQRLLATAGHSLRNQLISKFKDDDSFRHNFVGVLLTSIAVGNAQAVTEYLDMASRYALGQKYEEGKAWRLGTALQVACEYCDSGVATKILNLEDLSPLQLEKLYPWNAIHVACHQGDATMLNMLSEHDHSQYQALGQRTLPQYNPITIAATRGLYSILRNQLRAFRFISQDVDQQNAYGASPLYSVYQYGFLETLEELLGFVGLRFSTKRHNSEAMLLALKSGSDTLAIRAYSDYLGAIIDAICEAQNHHGQQSEDGADSPKENAEEQRVVEEAEKVIGEALFTAIQSGSQSSFRSIIRNLNEPAKIRDSMGRTPLMVSSIVGVVEFCDDLYTTDEDLKDDYKRTAMHCACQYGSLEIVEFLLRKGNQSSSVGPGEQPAAPLDLTQQDDLPATPLIRAALAGHKSIVNLLLPRLDCKALREEFFLAAKSGLEWILGPILGAVVEIDPTERTKCVNGVGEGGFTPLHDAAMSNHVRVVEFLLLHGADIEATNDSGNTPLALASDTSSLHSMKLLLHAGADTEAPIRRQRTVLTQAIFYEVESSVQLLLDNGALPRLCSNWSYYESLLDFTVKQSSDRVLKVLLTHFEKCNKRVSPGRLPKGIPTPEDCLRTIIEKGSFDSFNAFLEVWGDIDPILSRWMYEKKYEYEIGRRFKYAAAYGSFEVMERIYDRDCSNGQVDVNEWGGHYGTALEAAIAQSEDSMPKVKALIGWGAKLMPEDEEDGEKSSLASWKDKWLHSRWGTALHAAVWSADGGVIEFIIKQKPELKDQRDLMGRLPLHLAALYADYDMAQKLTSDQFPIAAGDYQQRNILHLACGVGDRSFVGSLFLSEESKFNALINEPDIQGWTPLHWAARSRNADLVEFLVQKGAKKGKRTISPEGWLPYHVAIYHNRVNLLVQLAVDSLDGGDVNGGDKPTEAGEYIGGTCDCCVCSLYGTRFSCTSTEPMCKTFDLCFKCAEYRIKIHPVDHVFEERGPY